MLKVLKANEKLTVERMRNGYTLRALSEKSGVHYCTIYRAENGSKINPKNALKLSLALNKAFDELFEIVDCAELQAV